MIALALLMTLSGQSSSRVAVVINSASPESKIVGQYYASKRGIPASQIITIKTTTDRKVSESAFRSEILGPIKSKLAALPRIDFIVMTKGVPIRILNDADHGVDALVGAHPLTFSPMSKSPTQTEMKGAISPYFQKNEPFSSKKFGFYLVTRIDGFTVDHAKALVDRSLSAKRSQGPFVFDVDPSKPDAQYNNLNAALKNIGQNLVKRGFKVVLDESRDFVGSSEPLMGYASWGSNDPQFSSKTYEALRFKPGAIADTFVSTSARRIFVWKEDPNTQSLIADLVEGGVTGVKGYVSEPYAVALSRPDILFDRYTRGFNLAESFAMASPFLKWKDLVLGDPLCAPYAEGK